MLEEEGVLSGLAPEVVAVVEAFSFFFLEAAGVFRVGADVDFSLEAFSWIGWNIRLYCRYI